MSQQEYNDRFDAMTATWLVKQHRRGKYFSDLSLLSRIELGAKLFELLDRFGEAKLRRILSSECPEIHWDDATTAMNFASACDREWLESDVQKHEK
jgi:hypothetical protein